MLKAEIEKLDDVNEKFQSLYTEKDGKFLLDEELIPEDITPLKNALQRLKDDKATEKAAADKLQKQIDDMKLADTEKNGTKEEIEALHQKIIDTQKAAHDAELKTAQELNHELTIGMVRNTIAGEIFINPDAYKLTDMESRIKLGEDGKTTYLVNRLGETVTKDQFVAELKGDKDIAFAIKGGKQSGGADHNQRNGGSGGKVKSMTDMSKDERKQYLKGKYPTLQ